MQKMDKISPEDCYVIVKQTIEAIMPKKGQDDLYLMLAYISLSKLNLKYEVSRLLNEMKRLPKTGIIHCVRLRCLEQKLQSESDQDIDTSFPCQLQNCVSFYTTFSTLRRRMFDMLGMVMGLLEAVQQRLPQGILNQQDKQ